MLNYLSGVPSSFRSPCSPMWYLYYYDFRFVLKNPVPPPDLIYWIRSSNPTDTENRAYRRDLELMDGIFIFRRLSLYIFDFFFLSDVTFKWNIPVKTDEVTARYILLLKYPRNNQWKLLMRKYMFLSYYNILNLRLIPSPNTVTCYLSPLSCN